MRPIQARYDNGLLRPEAPLALEQGERVALIVVRHSERKRWDLDRLARTGADEDLTLAEQGVGEWAEALDAEDRG
jgi:predicted DNA-binding antitoxin AbrB/MazE fold protein